MALHNVKIAYYEQVTLSGIGCTWKLVSPSPMWMSFGVPTRRTVTPSNRPPLTITYLSSSCGQHGVQYQWDTCSNAVLTRHVPPWQSYTTRAPWQPVPPSHSLAQPPANAQPAARKRTSSSV